MLNNKEDIINWLNIMNVEKYSINNNLTINVNGDVFLNEKSLTEIPIQFHIVNGSFYCQNNNLTTLKGCPKIVKSEFNCSKNSLTNLKGCPKTTLDGFICNDNKITSLRYCPKKVSTIFNVGNNCLNDLNYLPYLNYIKYFIFSGNLIDKDSLLNINVDFNSIEYIYSDFNQHGDKKSFLHFLKENSINKEKNILLQSIENYKNQKIKKL